MKKYKFLSLFVIGGLFLTFQNCGQLGLSSSSNTLENSSIVQDTLDPNETQRSLSILEGETLNLNMNAYSQQSSSGNLSLDYSIKNVISRNQNSRLSYNQNGLTINNVALSDEGAYAIVLGNDDVINVDLNVVPKIDVVSNSNINANEVRIEFTAPSEASFTWTHISSDSSQEIRSFDYELVEIARNDQMVRGYTIMDISNTNYEDGEMVFSIISDDESVQQIIDTRVDIESETPVVTIPDEVTTTIIPPVITPSEGIKERVVNFVRFRTGNSSGIDNNSGQMQTLEEARRKHEADIRFLNSRYGVTNVDYSGSFLIWGSSLVVSIGGGCIAQDHRTQYESYINGLSSDSLRRFNENHPTCGSPAIVAEEQAAAEREQDAARVRYTEIIFDTYRAALYRIPDQAGLDFYLAKLLSGEITSSGFKRDINESTEAEIQKLYVYHFRESADAAGLAYYIDQVDNNNFPISGVKRQLREAENCENDCL